MIDPLLTLTLNIQARKGIYALLIGSGVSRSAGIPTGWEVTVELVDRLARIEGAPADKDSIDWYEQKFGKTPDYADLLRSVASTSAAQQSLLKKFFEPTEEEREEGKKLPTRAHRAIAKLVKLGFIRVIVTTNFDKLLEIAISDEGVTPQVVSSVDDINGATPISHSDCTIFKVHGDYLDTRLKNSPEALAKYAGRVNTYLNRIFEEYGLIVCGWSADYDEALRAALKKVKSRRYPLYWTTISEPNAEAKSLIGYLRADLIGIESADSFFENVFEKLEALSEFDNPHPLSVQASVATLKKYLSEDKHRIKLHDLLLEEAGRARSRIRNIFQEIEGKKPDEESVRTVMSGVESSCEVLIRLFECGARYADRTQAKMFFDAFKLVLEETEQNLMYHVWIDLRKYPALLVIYAAGIASVEAENYSILHEICARPINLPSSSGKEIPTPAIVNTENVFQTHFARQYLVTDINPKFPLSHYLYLFFAPSPEAIESHESEYALLFDNFEYLWSLLFLDSQIRMGRSDGWFLPASFSWRRQSYRGPWLRDQAYKCRELRNVDWPPLKQGLFGSSIDRLIDVLAVEEQQYRRAAL